MVSMIQNRGDLAADQVSHYLPITALQVPDYYFDIHLPSWEGYLRLYPSSRQKN